jgi:hypothetical protein
MGSPYPLANAAEARWKKTLGLRDNPLHDLICLSRLRIGIWF